MPSGFFLSVLLLFLILLAYMLYDRAKAEKKLERRMSLLKRWADDQPTQARKKFRQIEVRLPKP
jgi:predicted PurR-regulated permease PerM